MRRAVSLPVLGLLLLQALTLAFSVGATLEPAQEYGCILRVVPEASELGPGGAVGRMFTVAVTMEAIGNVTGFDLKFGWNTTFLEYVHHTATIPVEEYPDPIPPSPYGGFLHAPKLLLADSVNTAAGTYHAAFATLGGPYFVGNGTAFVMTFRVRNQSSVEVEVPLDLFEVQVAHPGMTEFWSLACDGVVVIPPICSDVAVSKMVSSKTVVGEGHPVHFNITVENQGGYSEIFNLTFHANTTLIATVEGIALEKLVSITLPLSWDTTGLAKGSYNMNCSLTPAQNETDLADNSLNTLVTITILGDVDGDKDVDLYDIVTFAGAYNSRKGDTRYVGNCDLDDDGIIDIYDIVDACGNYGKSWSV